MQSVGAIFDELPIGTAQDASRTNDVCHVIDPASYWIAGKTVAFPVVVAEASMFMNAFLVDARVAQAMIGDSGFRVMELWPGKSILQLLAVDYRKNDLGDYNEAAILFPVLTPGERKPIPVFGAMWRLATGAAANYVYRMPVNQAFTAHAGRFIWGFPKWVTQVDIEFTDRRAAASFIDEDELVFSIAAKTGASGIAKEQRAASVAIRDGKAWKTWGSNAGSGVTFALGGERPVIGDSHPLARELRALGLPKKPLFSVAIANASMRFEGPEAVPIGAVFAT